MTTTHRYAVFGNPVKHSKSPAIHSQFALESDQDIAYRAVKINLDEFGSAARSFFESGGAGLNITVPFKQDAFAFADDLSDRAQAAGAVNTLWQDKDGRIQGDNTDGVGLVRDLIDNLGWQVKGLRVLMLGAGGAARGVIEPLLAQKPSQLLVVNRSPLKATELAHIFADRGPIQGGGFELLGEDQFDLVINATSTGLAGEMLELPSTLLTEKSSCYDMVYGSEPTAFMRWGAHNAAWAVSDGLGMLVEQAAESFFLWRGVKPETSSVIQGLRAAMDIT